MPPSTHNNAPPQHHITTPQQKHAKTAKKINNMYHHKKSVYLSYSYPTQKLSMLS